MTLSAKREYMRQMQTIYKTAHGKKEKSRILEQVSQTLACHRKHAIRLIRKPPAEVIRRFRDPIYPNQLIRILEGVWIAAQRPWSVRLKALLPLWLPQGLTRIRACLSTVRKNGRDLFEETAAALAGKPFMPEAAA